MSKLQESRPGSAPGLPRQRCCYFSKEREQLSDFILSRLVAELADFKGFSILDLFAAFVTVPLHQSAAILIRFRRLT